MREILEDVERWRARGEKVAIATVVATRRSAPRPVGAKLAISERGEFAGSVSGGCVESDVYEHACEVLASGIPRLLSYGIADEEAWQVGLPCGGEIDVFVEVLEKLVPVTERLLEAIRNGERGALFTVIEGEALGARVLVLESGERIGKDLPESLVAQAQALIRGHVNLVLDVDGARVFVEIYAPPPRLVVYGAVDTAEALCAAARLLGWHTIVADARARFATRERIPSADELIVAWPEDALAQLAPDHGTAVVVLIHDDKFDVPALQAAVASEAFYIGALGSRRNQERRRERLLAAGVGEKDLGRISGPCGLDIGADSQPETALSILAEIVAVRAGRDGGRLEAAKQGIHASVS
jgi:xanthine dehydrogenase accessory factor